MARSSILDAETNVEARIIEAASSDDAEEAINPRISPRVKRIGLVISVLASFACAYSLATRISGRSTPFLQHADVTGVEAKDEVTCISNGISYSFTDVYPNCDKLAGAPAGNYDCSGHLGIVKGNQKCTGTLTKEKSTITNPIGQCYSSVECKAPCFPGQAMVHLKNAGLTAMNALRVGDEVLVENAAGEFVHEPVLGFLHELHGESGFLTVSHARGEFRASANHLVFVEEGLGRVSKAVGDLRAGDRIFAVAATAEAVDVHTIKESVTQLGMYAPLTASGTVVVDGVVASVYAKPTLTAMLTHSVAHALFFPVRAYYGWGIHSIVKRLHDGSDAPHKEEEFHPFVEFLYKDLHLDSVIQ